jgi:hypothetical protein
MSYRCAVAARGYLQLAQDPADGGRADPVADLEHLTLDPLVPPGGVLGSEPTDEHVDLGPDRLSSCPVRVSPLPADQAAMPPQDGSGRDQPVRPQGSGQAPDQRGEHSTVVWGFETAPPALIWAFKAARSYSLMRPPRTAWRLIRSVERSATG